MILNDFMKIFSRLSSLLFPDKPRIFPGMRWLNIGLRSVHIIGVAGIGGGFLFTLDEAQWLPFWYLTLATGVFLVLLYLWENAIWLFQLKGIVIILKLLLLAIAFQYPEWQSELFITVIAISGFIAHAPGIVRGYTPFKILKPS